MLAKGIRVLSLTPIAIKKDLMELNIVSSFVRENYNFHKLFYYKYQINRVITLLQYYLLLRTANLKT